MNRLTEKLPPFAQKYREFQKINEAILPELEQVENEQEEIYNAQFILTCSEKYIKLWEESLGIVDGEQYSLEQRRINCINKKNNKLPYNRSKVNNRVYAIVPKEYCQITWGNNFINICVENSYESMKPYIYELLDGVLPLNMVIYITSRSITHGELKIYRHGQLKGYTHGEIKTLYE